MGVRQGQVERIEELFRQFFVTMHIEDGNPEVDLSHTPARMARMYVEELLSGYDDDELAALRARIHIRRQRPGG